MNLWLAMKQTPNWHHIINSTHNECLHLRVCVPWVLCFNENTHTLWTTCTQAHAHLLHLPVVVWNLWAKITTKNDVAYLAAFTRWGNASFVSRYRRKHWANRKYAGNMATIGCRIDTCCTQWLPAEMDEHNSSMNYWRLPSMNRNNESFVEIYE